MGEREREREREREDSSGELKDNKVFKRVFKYSFYIQLPFALFSFTATILTIILT